LTVAWIGTASAQFPDVTTPQPESQGPLTMFPHPVDSRFWISGQMNFIVQAHPSFAAQYSGTNSFGPSSQSATGRVLTLYTGVQLNRTTEVLFDVEEAGGLGLSSALGIAGFPNLDAVTDPKLGAAPYVARIFVHKVIALGGEQVESSPGPLSTFAQLPARRFELRAGKFGITDFFDNNLVGSDSHLQFLNWAIDQNGAYDFTADARGYTWGVMLEYQEPRWGVRVAEVLWPGPNNGGPLVWNLHQANSTNLEFELHRAFLPKKAGVIRVLAYASNGNMGRYDVANDQFLDGKTILPNIANHPLQITTKYGFGANFEQVLTRNLVGFGRFGWNNGSIESWSFSEINQSVSGGFGFLGRLWRRKYDRAGVAVASNAIASPHARYLSLGGLGAFLGDGSLKYGRENIFEGYYTAHVWRGLWVGPDFQYVVNPGYNQARGPVFVGSFRAHLEL
jgi:high affinity Mn2+ porin